MIETEEMLDVIGKKTMLGIPSILNTRGLLGRVYKAQEMGMDIFMLINMVDWARDSWITWVWHGSTMYSIGLIFTRGYGSWIRGFCASLASKLAAPCFG